FDLPNASGTLALTTTPPASHTHGNIANDGKIGSTANLPLITTTAGAVTTGAFGTGATDFCAGNDSRLSDARTPTSHTHGNITNSGAIGSTSGLPIKTGTSGVLEAGAFGTSAGQFAEGNHTHSQLHNQSHVITSTSDHTANNWKVWYSNGSGQVTELSLGAANTVLTSNGASSAPTFTAPAAGGSKTYARFTALDNQPTSANFATLDTRNSIAVLDFDDASTESAVFVGVMPEGASLGSGLIVYLHFMATTATSGNVRWSVAFERSNTDLDADSFDTATAATVATSGTSGIVTVGSITCTAIDGITAGDLFRLRVQRLGADAADTMTGDAELIAVEVRSAA
ncbi:MAG: hypothetical protein EBR82_63130, partial [Caulobacteraceae bacterium]|nr:hypothetical protein [Caulobacteraceae bacterium]